MSETYSNLAKKYKDFKAPTVKIKVDSTEIVYGTGLSVGEIEVELSTSFAASGCSFSVYNQYKAKETDFDRTGAFKALQIGAKVEIELGYITTSPVFTGLIIGLTYQFEETGESPSIRVECMDAKCLLMKTQRLDIMGEVKLSKAVSDMLGEQPVSSYLDGSKVDTLESSVVPLHNSMMSDYDFMVAQAKYLGCEFFVLNGKLFYRKKPTSGSPTVVLSPQGGILSATVTIQGNSIVNKVTVNGVDPTGEKQVTSSATASGTYSLGNTGKKMLGSSEQVYYDPYSVDASSAGKLAKNLLATSAEDFGTINCFCVGLPEIVPGSYIKTSGMMKEADGTFYVASVKHIFNGDGYITIFEARFSSL